MALVERTKLNPGSSEYRDVADEFNSKNVVKGNKMLEVVSIERVHNDLLEQRFLQKKKQYERTYGHVRVVKGWHGTKEANVAPILRNNFDVSKHGQGVGHRFGAGVSFSSMASYASYYCDKGAPTCSMLLVDVLVSNVVEVPENRNPLAVLHEPPLLPGHGSLRYDTTAKNKERMDVFVKFDDDAYLPTHVVHFQRGSRAAGVAASTKADLALLLELLKSFGWHENGF
ncbi:protein mono-ADP-ribosyltransferase PARP10-like [Thrips palmi]|uniref:Poly [ADP-ribose] polymerase n=1 Tax=Thrips palmi TaxID=161013 RepID=A0A6P9A9M3_THRPL|nr:protein mono-ADP-ribosyltransferase PARP10-like [Thrips palmi]XP_034254749.1 protein mono-ADP-ribosyltransferase PARP10-like [Thrips palmi]